MLNQVEGQRVDIVKIRHINGNVKYWGRYTNYPPRS